MERRTIREVIKWNKAQIAKSKDERDIARFRENIRKLEEILADDAS